MDLSVARGLRVPSADPSAGPDSPREIVVSQGCPGSENSGPGLLGLVRLFVYVRRIHCRGSIMSTCLESRALILRAERFSP